MVDPVELKERDADPKCCCCFEMYIGINLAAMVAVVDAIYMLCMAFAGFLFYSVGKS